MSYNKHQKLVQGDFSFMENLLSKNQFVHHMDSYNVDGKIRFQGSFYYIFGEGEVVCNECPLEILKSAINYQMNICKCKGEPHITWTIWF